jgi:hypothetical protein
MSTRTFLLTGAATAFVIVTEEFPAEHRGWAIGMLGALGACGHGLGAALFAAIDVLPYGWRALYAVGLAPLVVLPRFRREVRETRRFTRHRASGAEEGTLRTWHRPLASLARTHPGRATGLALAGTSSRSARSPSSSSPATTRRRCTAGRRVSSRPWSSSAARSGSSATSRGPAGRRPRTPRGRRRLPRRVPDLRLHLLPGRRLIVPLAWVSFVFCGTAGDIILRALSTGSS